METDTLFLDAAPARSAVVGYGALGRNGSLGYEDKRVEVAGRAYDSALSAHPPSRLVFDLDGRFGRFICDAALNGDVPAGRSHADFSVHVDGRRAAAVRVAAGEPPRPLSADVSGARFLELRVDTQRWPFCHAVWLEPRLEPCPETAAAAGTVLDCLGRAEIVVPYPPLRAERCIATVVSPGFEGYLDAMLSTLWANGGCPDALLAVFAVGESPEIDRVAARYGASVVRCRRRASLNCAIKSILYSAARVVDAGKLLCLDADMLVLGDLAPVFTLLDTLDERSILVCREGNGISLPNVGEALRWWYGGKPSDVRRLLGQDRGEGGYPLIVNDGLMAGRRDALLALDACIHRMPGACAWIAERPQISWRNQFVLNLALAHLDCGVELDSVYNVQLLSQHVEPSVEGGRLRAAWRDREACVLHFNGAGRPKYPAFRNLLAAAR